MIEVACLHTCGGGYLGFWRGNPIFNKVLSYAWMHSQTKIKVGTSLIVQAIKFTGQIEGTSSSPLFPMMGATKCDIEPCSNDVTICFTISYGNLPYIAYSSKLVHNWASAWNPTSASHIKIETVSNMHRNIVWVAGTKSRFWEGSWAICIEKINCWMGIKRHVTQVMRGQLHRSTKKGDR